MKNKNHRNAIATAKSSPGLPVREKIEKRAYELWMASGSLHGQDIANWLQAESEVLDQQRQIRMRRPTADA